jgi:hypothetical protein
MASLRSKEKKSKAAKQPENLAALRKGLAQALTVSKAELDARLKAARERKQKEGRTRYPS